MFSSGAFHRQKPVGLCLVAVVNVTRAHLTIAVPAVCHILKPFTMAPCSVCSTQNDDELAQWTRMCWPGDALMIMLRIE